MRFALGLVFFACGRTQPSPGCADLYVAVSDWHVQCGVASFGDVRDRAERFCAAIADAPGVSYDAESACIAALATAECKRWPHECVALSTGTLPEGAACSDMGSGLHAQCRSGTCISDAEGCGRCSAARLEGASCGTDAPCAP